MTKVLPFALALTMLSASACRPKSAGNGSSAKSLDNIGKAPKAQTTNVCGIKYTGKEAVDASVQELIPRIKGRPKHKNAVIGALTAVPQGMLKPFSAAGGRIVITADTPTKCQGTPFSVGDAQMAGTPNALPACWKIEPGVGPVIYMKPSVKLIRHATVRMFGYFYTEFFVAKVLDPLAPAPFNDLKWKDAATAFVAERDALAASFLLDLEPANKALHDSLVKVQATDAKSFGNYIFAEATDSYYCSAQSRETFGKQFNLTYQRFANGANAHSATSTFGSR